MDPIIATKAAIFDAMREMENLSARRQQLLQQLAQLEMQATKLQAVRRSTCFGMLSLKQKASRTQFASTLTRKKNVTMTEYTIQPVRRGGWLGIGFTKAIGG